MNLKTQSRTKLARGLVLSIATGALVAPLALGGGIVTAASANDGASAASGSFADPSMSARPAYRFWTGGGHLTAASAANQVAQMKALGAGGVEFNQAGGTPGYVAATEGFGTPAWSDALQAVLEAAKANDMQGDHIYTPGWSAGIQGLSFDKPGTDKKITFGKTLVEAGTTFTGAVPSVTLPNGVTKADLQAVVAYRCATDCAETTPKLNPRGSVDLTAQVVNGQLTWAAPASPAGTTWIIVAGWMSGTGKTNGLASTATPSRVVDHFSLDGFNAIKAFWDKSVLDAGLKDAIAKSDGSLFFDSLELEEGTNKHWTANFLQEFQERRGYSLVPYIAVVAAGTPSFDFADDTGERVREDYRQTLSDLFRDYHLKPLKKWANDRGLTLRGQAYSSNFESSLDLQEMAGLLDVAEGEDRSFNNPSGTQPFTQNRSSDIWRAMSSASNQVGTGQVSTECCAVGGALRVPRQDLLADINQQLVTGVNHFVFHGWGDTTGGTGANWPGFGLFGGGVADTYGVFNATAVEDRSLNDYVARLNTVLRRGELRADVAMYRDGGGHSIAGATGDLYFTDQSLAKAGYTYGFMNKSLIADKKAVISNGRLLSGSLAYGAFVMNNTKNVNNEPAVDLASAQKILGWAKAGLPIVVVGQIPDRTRGFKPGDDAQLQDVLEDLSDLPNVSYVKKESDVLGAVQSAGLKPAASFTESSSFLNIRRETADTNYYYLWNGDGAERETSTVELKGEGDPYQFNPWTGKVSRIAQFVRTDDGVKVTVSAAPGDGKLIALTKGNADTAGLKAPFASVVSTTADRASVDADGKLNVQTSSAGTYKTVLSDGRTVETVVDSVPAATTLKSFKLDIVKYSAGAVAAETVKTPLPTIDVTAGEGDKLPNWQQIDGLSKVGGESAYTTTLDVSSDVANKGGAKLDLGSVLGTFRVSVNGKDLPRADLLDSSDIDLGGYLNSGSNTITVHVDTLLGNTKYNGSLPYGLVGPVVATPYRTAAVTPAVTPPVTPPTTPPSKVAPSVSFKLSSSSIKVGKNAKATVVVKAKGVTGPTGTITIKKGNKTLKIVNLSASQNGRKTFTIPKLPKGKHTLKVVYSGDSSVSGKTSVTRTLRVK